LTELHIVVHDREQRAELLTEAVEVEHNRMCCNLFSAYRTDGRPDEAAPSVNRLHLREEGPLAVVAELGIKRQESRIRATLCRCGLSKKKPFCEGSHHDGPFKATGEPGTSDVTPLQVRGRRLDVRPMRDGPLWVKGNLEIGSGTGRTVGQRTPCALCRCGGSANTPYRDGSHRTNGFQREA